MHFFGVIIEDRAKMEPAVESFILIFSFYKIKEVFLFEISKFDVTSSVVLVKVNNFFEFLLFLVHHYIRFYHDNVLLWLS